MGDGQVGASGSQVRTPRSIDTKNNVTFTWGSLEEFLAASQLSPGIHSVWHHGLPIDMAFQARPGAPLVAVFHGGTDDRVRLPFLSGQAVTTGLAVSKLFISDPSLYLAPELRIAWFAGNRHQPDLFSDLLAIISKFMESVGASHLVTLGGSCGGYASLRVAQRIGTPATAVIMNPQTSIHRHYEHKVQLFRDLCWAGGELPPGLDLCVDPPQAQTVVRPLIFYLQNAQDEFHVRHHLTPFVEAGAFYDNGWLITREWGEGHVPPPKEAIRQALEFAVTGTGEEEISQAGYRRV